MIISAVQLALGLPEVVGEILSNIQENRTLFICVQVNKLWANEACNHLWRVNPPYSALLAFHRNSRLDYYTSKIETFSFYDSKDFRATLPTCTRFPRLKRIIITTEIDYYLQRCLMQFVHAQVKRIDIYAPIPSSAYLMGILVSAWCENQGQVWHKLGALPDSWNLHGPRRGLRHIRWGRLVFVGMVRVYNSRPCLGKACRLFYAQKPDNSYVSYGWYRMQYTMGSRLSISSLRIPLVSCVEFGICSNDPQALKSPCSQVAYRPWIAINLASPFGDDRSSGTSCEGSLQYSSQWIIVDCEQV